jgi:hypothetical protein
MFANYITVVLFNYFFRKFTLLCAISNSKCVGGTFYKEGGMIFYIFYKKYKIWIN